MNQCKVSKLDFLNFEKHEQRSMGRFHYTIVKVLVCKLFGSLGGYLRAAPVPYVQAAILNLPHRTKEVWVRIMFLSST